MSGLNYCGVRMNINYSYSCGIILLNSIQYNKQYLIITKIFMIIIRVIIILTYTLL